MRALLVYPEMPLAYWSMPHLVKLKRARALLPPLSLLTVAALLPEEWEFRLVDLNVRPMTEEDWEWSELVMISGQFIQRYNIVRLISEAKQRGKITVVGGPYATSYPNETLLHGCDFLFRGEVEDTLAEIVYALERGDSKGIFVTTDRPDMSKSPIPRFDLINGDDYAFIGIQTSRGCPYDCEFCDVVNLYGHKFRSKTPRQVTQELEAVFKLGWRGEVFICDDNYVGSRKHAKAHLEELVPWMKTWGNPFSYITQASVDLGQDPEILQLMSRANFRRVFVGIETPDEDVLKKYGKTPNVKFPALQSLENIAVNGIQVMGSLVIGFDGEKPGLLERMCSFVDKSSIPTLYIGILIATHNTRLWHRLRQEGRLYEDAVCGYSLAPRPNFRPEMSEDELLMTYYNTWEHIYEPSRFLKRTYQYHLKMRPNSHGQTRLKDLPWSIGRVFLDGRRLRTNMIKIRGFIQLLWRHVYASEYRLQFWKQLVGILVKNPRMTGKYFTTLLFGEDFVQFRPMIQRGARRHERAIHRRLRVAGKVRSTSVS